MTRQIRKLSKQKYYTSATIPKYYTYRIKFYSFFLEFNQAFRVSKSLIIRTWDGERYKGKWIWFSHMKNWIIIDETDKTIEYFKKEDIAYWKYENLIT